MMFDDVLEPRRRDDVWFHELADDMSDVDGSAVVWLAEPGEFARPVVLPRARRPEDGYRTLGN